MTTLFNSFEEGVNGLTISTGNSGGAPNNAFDVVTVGTGATVAYDNTHAVHGTLAAKIQTPATAQLAFFRWQSSFGNPTTAYARAYFYFTANPATQTRVINFSNNVSGSCGTANINGTGHIVGSNGTAGTTTFTFTNAIPLNQWFRIEVAITGDPTAGALSISLYNGDSTIPVETHSASAINTTAAPNEVQFGACVAAIANIGPYWIDDVGASDVGPLGPSVTSPIPPQPGTFVAPRRYPSRAVCSAVYSTGNTPAASSPGVASSHPFAGAFLARSHWTFPISGTPAANNYFIVNQGQAESISWSDQFWAYYNGNVVAGPFTVNSFSQPFAGFVNVTFTPASPFPLDQGVQVIEGQQLDQANPPNPAYVAPRNPRQIHRAWVGGVSSAGTDRRTTSGGFTVNYEGGQVAGGLPSYQPNILRPGINGQHKPVAAKQIPRRRPARAVTGSSGSLGSGVAGPQPPPSAAVPGRVQPAATVMLPRRRPARAVTNSVIAPFPAPIGTIQPRATIPVPRRAHSRAFLSLGNSFIYPGPNQSGPSGTLQPQYVFVLPRRTSTRAVTRSVTSQTFPNGQMQPRATVAIPRRYPSRVWARSVTAPFPRQQGTIQPRATIAIPRRKAARAWLQDIEAPFLYGPVTTGGIVRRRTAARAVVQSLIGQFNAHGPSGTMQPRATVPLPRRTSSRALVINGEVLVFLPPNAPGSIQPRATVRIPRRYPSRFWTQDIEGVSFPNGIVQPRATVPVPRRASARALVQSVLGTANAHGPSGVAQPRTTISVPRRYPSRVTQQSALGTQNAHGPSGVTQPRATVPVPRRYPARGSFRLGTGTPSIPSGTIQPRATVPLPRRYPSRAIQGHAYGFALPGGSIQPRATIPLPRRYPFRAVTGHVYGQPQAPGSIQPRPTIGLPRRYPSRAVTHGNPVAPFTVHTVTGGIVGRRGRYPSRAVLFRFISQVTPPGKPVTGGIVRRRQAYRCVTANVIGQANAHGPSGAQPGGIVRRRRPYPAVCGTQRIAGGFRGRPGTSVYVLFTSSPPQCKWQTGTVSSRWKTSPPMSEWVATNVPRGTFSPGA